MNLTNEELLATEVLFRIAVRCAFAFYLSRLDFPDNYFEMMGLKARSGR